VPRITAPTVAEHRSAQRAALLRAAAEVIVEDGVAAATPSKVGERAGIARSTVYDYFASREELLVAVAINAFEEWGRDMSAALEGAPPGLPRLHRYVEATIALSTDGRHDLATAMRPADLSPSRREEIVALHDALVGPLMAVLAEAGVQTPAEYAPYVQAMIGVGLARVAAGDAPDEVAARLNRIVTDGLPRGA